MSYDRTLILKKTGLLEYTLYNNKGVTLLVISNAGLETEAMDRAKAWASSWSSTEVITEHEHKSRG